MTFFVATTTAETLAALSFYGILSGKLPSVNGILGSNQQNDELIAISPSLEIPPIDEIKPLLIASSSSFLRSVTLQIFLSGAASMVARGGGALVTTSTAVNVAAHQIALQIWLLGSFICDSLAAASQTLIASGIAKQNSNYVLKVSSTILNYSIGLGLVLSIIFFSLSSIPINGTNLLSNFFTNDIQVQNEFMKIIPLIIISQPLNSIVFACDGILQGCAEFTYQAKGMVISVSVAILFYYIVSSGSVDVDVDASLMHVWEALIVLQGMRGIVSFVKIFDGDGPIKLKI